MKIAISAESTIDLPKELLIKRSLNSIPILSSGQSSPWSKLITITAPM